MSDPTESIRRAMIASDVPTDRERLETEHGQVWDTDQMQEAFTVKGFAAPFVVVARKSDNAVGSLRFQARPRFYYGFQPN